MKQLGVLSYFINTNIDKVVEPKIPLDIFMVTKNFLSYIKWAKELKRSINFRASSQQRSAYSQEENYVMTSRAGHYIIVYNRIFLSSYSKASNTNELHTQFN